MTEEQLANFTLGSLYLFIHFVLEEKLFSDVGKRLTFLQT